MNLQKLKESTSLLELVLWKINIDASTVTNGVAMGDNNRLECRANCGDDFVIENVWPYLLPSDFVRSYVYIYIVRSSVRDEEDSDSDSSFEDDDDVDDDIDEDDENNNDDGWED
jgi:hypothetical protein